MASLFDELEKTGLLDNTTEFKQKSLKTNKLTEPSTHDFKSSNIIQERYTRLAENLTTIKQTPKSKHSTPIRICLWCGSLFRNTSPSAHHCSMSCAAKHRSYIRFNNNQDHHKAQKTTSWCAHGNPIINDINHQKLTCDTPNCNCTYSLIQQRSSLFRCIICNTYHSSLRQPLVCSQACADTFNNLPSKQRRELLPYILDKLSRIKEDFLYISLITRDLNPPTDQENPSQIDEASLFKSLSMKQDPYELINHCETLSYTNPITALNYNTNNRILIRQTIYTIPDPSNPTVTQSIPLYTIHIVSNPDPRNTCKYQQLIPPSNDTVINKAAHIIDYTSPSIYQLKDMSFTAKAWRILFLSTTIPLIRSYLPNLTSTLPKIYLKNTPTTIYYLTPTQLTTLIATIKKLHGQCEPHTYNEPLYLPYKTSINALIPLPQYNPTNQTFHITTTYTLCQDKTAYPTFQSYLTATGTLPPPVYTL